MQTKTGEKVNYSENTKWSNLKTDSTILF